MAGFNSRARVGATSGSVYGTALVWFQFTRPGGRDTLDRVKKEYRRKVSIHAPGWARRGEALKAAWDYVFQFTRPGGRDSRSCTTTARRRVSIHAPGWARPMSRSVPTDRHAFQFTRPGGRDVSFLIPLGAKKRVSIHAPGWARRAVRGGGIGFHLVSIHAPGWARLALHGKRNHSLIGFQFTRPGGRDLSPCPHVSLEGLFQFTRPGGRDSVAALRMARLISVSIHAPGWARLTEPLIPN